MCRLLVAHFQEATDPRTLLTAFVKMAEASKSLDGDWQGDGWGAAWLTANNTWNTYSSLAPVWQDQAAFAQIPSTRSLAVHARSASFPEHKGVLAFNQPYVAGPYAFTFNGLVKGVSLPPIPGRIGAEKIWHLLQQELLQAPPDVALERLRQLLLTHAKEVIALNIGLATPDGIFALNQFSRHPEYYTLQHAKTASMELICSEPLDFLAP